MPYLDEATEQDVLTYLKILDDEHVATGTWLEGEKKKRAVLEAQRAEALLLRQIAIVTRLWESISLD